jgi:hypothetical protein
LNTYVLLRRESIIATPDPLLSLALLRDKQRLSLEELLMVVNINYKPSISPAYIHNSITKHRSRDLN